MESFWLDQGNLDYALLILGKMTEWGACNCTADEVLGIANLYATLIDQMSPFTATHSHSVSRVAVLLAAEMGFCNTELTMMRIAGLLHDLGKFSVSNDILNKPGALTLDDDEHRDAASLLFLPPPGAGGKLLRHRRLGRPAP